MKKLNISIIAVLLIMMSSYVNAQNIVPVNDNNQSSPFAIRMHVSPPFSLLSTRIKSDTYNDEKKDGLGYTMGADFVYYYFRNDKFRASVSLGFGLSNYRSSRQLSYTHSVNTTDIDGDDVLITETVDNMFEVLSLKYLDIPLKFGFEFTLSETLDAYLSVGATYGLNLKGKYKNEATITRTGYYAAYNALIFDVDVDGSPYFYPTNKRMTSDDVVALKKNISLEAALGLKYKLNSKLSFLVGVKYMHGLSDIVDESSSFIVKHDDAYHYSLNSLAVRGDKIQTRALGIEFGLQLKLW